MDNDLMARRLRPPSEPFQPIPPPSPSQPTPEQAGYWPPDDAPQPQSESQPTSEAGSASTPELTQPGTWDPLAREDFPWDRPSDYADPTDSATLDQTAWDRPSNDDWFDEPVDDRTPADDWMNDTTERPVTPTADEPLAARSHGVEQAMAVSPTPVVLEVEPEPVLADPDDAYAPVLGDVSVPMGRGWLEMNGHDAGRNDATVAADPVVAQALAAPAPMAQPAPEPQLEAWPQADRTPPAEAPGQTSWFTSAVEPTTVAPGVGPTPPAGLFDDGPAIVELPASAEWDAPDWEAPADATEWDVPAAIQKAYEFQPEWEPSPAAETSPDTAPQPEVIEAPPESAPMDEPPQIPPVTQSASPYSTAPAPATPFVVRVEVSIVGESKSLGSPAESARILGAADFPVSTVADAEVDADAEEFPPAPAVESVWVESSGPAKLVEGTDWLDRVQQSQPEPAPWVEPTPPVQEFADATVVPPWAAARTPQPAPAPFTPLPPVAPPPTPAPVATHAPALVEEPASRWVQPMYYAEPVTQMPLTAAPSPSAPAPVAGPYAQPIYGEPLQTEPSAVSSTPTMSTRASAVIPADVDGKEPSRLLTGAVTIAVAVLVVVLVLGFIQLMTSLLR